MKKRIIGIFICTLFIGLILACINGIAVEQDMRMIVPSNIPETTSDDILFSDDFNDNTKDYNKWMEIYSNGIWEETNGRAEFQLTESGETGARSEGIQSKAIATMIDDDEPWDNRVKVTWTMYPTIDATSSEGKVMMKITEGRNYIVVEYDRTGGVARCYDSLGNNEVFIGGDEPWDNKLEICGDRYFVTMNMQSVTVYTPIFSSGSVTLRIELFIELGGSTRTKYLRSGFDDIIVSHIAEDQPPSTPTVDGPNRGKINTLYNYTFNSTDPEGDAITYLIEWGDSKNDTVSGESGEVVTVQHAWSSQGHYNIRAKAKDIYGAESGWGSLTVTMPKSKSILNIKQREFTAEIGVGDEKEPRVYLDGNYRLRGKFTIVHGTATNGEQEVRFQGLFRGNHFILQIPLRGRIVNIIGRYTIDENREFSGRWTIRGTEIKGWIKGTIN